MKWSLGDFVEKTTGRILDLVSKALPNDGDYKWYHYLYVIFVLQIGWILVYGTFLFCGGFMGLILNLLHRIL